MSWLNHLRINRKLFVLMSILFLLLIGVTTVVTYNRQRNILIKSLTENARVLSWGVTEHVREASVMPSPLNLTGRGFHDPSDFQKRLRDFGLQTDYGVSFISPEVRGAHGTIPEVEATQYSLLKQNRGAGRMFLAPSGGKIFLFYLHPMIADSSCLHCHGRFEVAPPEIRASYPAGSGMYDHAVGDFMGAISISVPMRGIQETIWATTIPSLVTQSLLYLFTFIVIGTMIRRQLVDPVTYLTQQLNRMRRNGAFTRLKATAGDAEFGDMVTAYNELLADLTQHEYLYRESEQRCRSLIEMAYAAVVTFNAFGTIVFINEKAEQLLQLSRTAALGKNIFEFMDDGEEIRDSLPACSFRGEPGEQKKLRRTYLHLPERGKIAVEIGVAVSNCNEGLYTAVLWQLEEERLER